ELQEKGYVPYEHLPLENRSGQKVEVEFVSNVYAENDHQVVQCNIRDITERSQMQVKLRDAQQRLRFGMDSMPQKIFTATPIGDVNYFNPSWAHYTGLSFQHIRNWGW